jgi:dihydroorotate dehydrogenase electron transfer subunit
MSSSGERSILRPGRHRTLIIGDGAGIGPVIQLVERVRGERATSGAAAPPWTPLALLGSSEPFPFRPRPSVIIVPGIPPAVIACMPLLEEWGVASRLASTLDLPGCFEGSVTALANTWLASLRPDELGEVEIFARGPLEVLHAAAALARRYALPCDA